MFYARGIKFVLRSCGNLLFRAVGSVGYENPQWFIALNES